MKSLFVLVTTLLLIVSGILVLIILDNESPEVSLRKNWDNTPDGQYSVIEQIYLNSKYCILCCQNMSMRQSEHKLNVEMVFMKKRLFGYEILFECPINVPQIDSENAWIFFTAVHRKTKWASICYIWNGCIKSVSINGNNIPIHEIDGNRVCWTGGIDYSAGIDYILYDEDGGIIESGNYII